MFRLIAKIGAASLGGGAGWFVYANMKSVFEGIVPLAAAGVVVVFVFSIFYFPLFRPIADAVSDRLSVAVRRGRHIRTGSGIGELPERPSLAVRCSICGAPDGPICSSCQAEMDRSRRSRF